MSAVRVVLVEPKNEGNVGAVARAMRNFDVADLVLVRPCPIGDEARKRAMHGADVLEAARAVQTFEEGLRGADLVVGTSGIDTSNERKFARISVTPRDLTSKVLVTIPASEDYPILNLSHAATILLYELFAGRPSRRPRRKASGLEKDRLLEALGDLMEATDYPAHKRSRTKVMFRRLMGRAVPSAWEFHALMGVLQRATKRIQRLERGR